MKKKTPFYKYVSPGTLELIVGNGTLKMSTPSEFNDPFDCNYSGYSKNFNIEKEFLRTFKSYPVSKGELSAYFKKQGLYNQFNGVVFDSLEELRRNWDEYIESYRVLCLTPLKNSILMWSHYAQFHSGTVIGFDFSNESYEEKIIPVKYPFKDTMIDDFVSNCVTALFSYLRTYEGGFEAGMEQVDKFMSNDASTKQIVLYALKHLHPCFFYKKKVWEYEEEYRYVRPSDEGEFLPFSKMAIKEIIFGIKTSDDEKKRVLEIISSPDYNVEVSQAYKENSQLRFSKVTI